MINDVVIWIHVRYVIITLEQSFLKRRNIFAVANLI
jgi:hypothetical protein